jgi:hypothetical protein
LSIHGKKRIEGSSRCYDADEMAEHILGRFVSE